jgi:hypothetical protein
LEVAVANLTDLFAAPLDLAASVVADTSQSIRKALAYPTAFLCKRRRVELEQWQKRTQPLGARSPQSPSASPSVSFAPSAVEEGKPVSAAFDCWIAALNDILAREDVAEADAQGALVTLRRWLRSILVQWHQEDTQIEAAAAAFTRAMLSDASQIPAIPPEIDPLAGLASAAGASASGSSSASEQGVFVLSGHASTLSAADAAFAAHTSHLPTSDWAAEGARQRRALSASALMTLRTTVANAQAHSEATQAAMGQWLISQKEAALSAFECGAVRVEMLLLPIILEGAPPDLMSAFAAPELETETDWKSVVRSTRFSSPTSGGGAGDDSFNGSFTDNITAALASLVLLPRTIPSQLHELFRRRRAGAEADPAAFMTAVLRDAAASAQSSLEQGVGQQEMATSVSEASHWRRTAFAKSARHVSSQPEAGEEQTTTEGSSEEGLNAFLKSLNGVAVDGAQGTGTQVCIARLAAAAMSLPWRDLNGAESTWTLLLLQEAMAGASVRLAPPIPLVTDRRMFHVELFDSYLAEEAEPLQKVFCMFCGCEQCLMAVGSAAVSASQPLLQSGAATLGCNRDLHDFLSAALVSHRAGLLRTQQHHEGFGELWDDDDDDLFDFNGRKDSIGDAGEGYLPGSEERKGSPSRMKRSDTGVSSRSLLGPGHVRFDLSGSAGHRQRGSSAGSDSSAPSLADSTASYIHSSSLAAQAESALFMPDDIGFLSNDWNGLPVPMPFDAEENQHTLPSRSRAMTLVFAENSLDDATAMRIGGGEPQEARDAVTGEILHVRQREERWCRLAQSWADSVREALAHLPAVLGDTAGAAVDVSASASSDRLVDDLDSMNSLYRVVLQTCDDAWRSVAARVRSLPEFEEDIARTAQAAYAVPRSRSMWESLQQVSNMQKMKQALVDSTLKYRLVHGPKPSFSHPFGPDVFAALFPGSRLVAQGRLTDPMLLQRASLQLPPSAGAGGVGLRTPVFGIKLSGGALTVGMTGVNFPVSLLPPFARNGVEIGMQQGLRLEGARLLLQSKSLLSTLSRIHLRSTPPALPVFKALLTTLMVLGHTPTSLQQDWELLQAEREEDDALLQAWRGPDFVQYTAADDAYAFDSYRDTNEHFLDDMDTGGSNPSSAYATAMYSYSLGMDWEAVVHRFNIGTVLEILAYDPLLHGRLESLLIQSLVAIAQGSSPRGQHPLERYRPSTITEEGFYMAAFEPNGDRIMVGGEDPAVKTVLANATAGGTWAHPNDPRGAAPRKRKLFSLAVDQAERSGIVSMFKRGPVIRMMPSAAKVAAEKSPRAAMPARSLVRASVRVTKGKKARPSKALRGAPALKPVATGDSAADLRSGRVGVKGIADPNDLGVACVLTSKLRRTLFHRPLIPTSAISRVAGDVSLSEVSAVCPTAGALLAWATAAIGMRQNAVSLCRLLSRYAFDVILEPRAMLDDGIAAPAPASSLPAPYASAALVDVNGQEWNGAGAETGSSAEQSPPAKPAPSSPAMVRRDDNVTVISRFPGCSAVLPLGQTPFGYRLIVPHDAAEVSMSVSRAVHEMYAVNDPRRLRTLSSAAGVATGRPLASVLVEHSALELGLMEAVNARIERETVALAAAKQLAARRKMRQQQNAGNM